MSEPTDRPSPSPAEDLSPKAAPPSRRQIAKQRRRALVEGLPRLTRWFVEDGIRAVVAFIPVLVGAWIMNAFITDDRTGEVIYYIGILAIYLPIYALVTMVAFVGVKGSQLRQAMAVSRGSAVIRHETALVPGTYLRPRTSSVGGDGASWPMMVALTAIVVVVLLVTNPSLHSHPGVVAASLALVAGAWFGTLVAYAVHVARVDLLDGGLKFPGDQDPEDRTFSDYLYLALTTQASLGPGDVSLTTARMRRTISGHVLVSYLFNTLVLAMLVSLLVTVSV